MIAVCLAQVEGSQREFEKSVFGPEGTSELHFDNGSQEDPASFEGVRWFQRLSDIEHWTLRVESQLGRSEKPGSMSGERSSSSSRLIPLCKGRLDQGIKR